MTGKETIKRLDNQYAKLLAITMRMHRLPHVVITAADIEKALVGGCNIVVQELEDGLHIRVVGDEEARRIQALENRFDPPRNPFQT